MLMNEDTDTNSDKCLAAIAYDCLYAAVVFLDHGVESPAKAKVAHDVKGQVAEPICHVLTRAPLCVICIAIRSSLCAAWLGEIVTEDPHVLDNQAFH